MCGLVGMAGTLGQKDIEAFNDLLIIDYIRGKDSTGVGAVNRNRTWDLVKGATDPIYLQGTKAYDKAVNQGKCALIGHNRKATMGAVNRFNSHPFEFENILGAHNGVLGWETKNRYLNTTEFDTDSEALFYNMDKQGFAETMKKTGGAFALSFYDKESHQICLTRNAERPLYYGWSESRKTIYWASEYMMLRLVLGRLGIKLEEDNLYPVSENTVIRWQIPDRDKPFDKAKISSLPKFEPVVHKSYGGDRYLRGPYGQSGGWNMSEWEDGMIADDNAETFPFALAEDKAKQTEADKAIAQARAAAAAGASKATAEADLDGRPEGPEPDVNWTDQDIGTGSAVMEKSNFVAITKPKGMTQKVFDKRLDELFKPPYFLGSRELTKEEFAEILSFNNDACSWCEDNIEYGDRVMVNHGFYAHPNVLCGKCIQDGEVQEFFPDIQRKLKDGLDIK
jgi:predicted glutamine amidotransferase